jgi:hypothetical protein
MDIIKDQCKDHTWQAGSFQAIQRLHTGQRIRMDGSAGKIFLLEA